jgi:hypothetical protein
VACHRSDYERTNGSDYDSATKNDRVASLLNYKPKAPHEVHMEGKYSVAM